MTIVPPAAGEPRRPDGPRDAGDAWVVAPTGEKYWGRFGAAGLLAVDAARGVLLQHRVGWSHFGGTWALPGGARHAGETAIDGALREATEEAGVPQGSVCPRLVSVLELGYWSYATVVCDVVAPFEPVISDPESLALEWVGVQDVEDYPLHPGFASSWARLRELIKVRPVILVDAANVVGSVPDGWWRDRAGAAGRLLVRLEALARAGVSAHLLGLAEHLWFPELVVVLEGHARRAAVPAPAVGGRGAGAQGAGAQGAGAGGAGAAVSVVYAEGEGDDTIAAEATRLQLEGCLVTVVTSDRGLSQRVIAAGATVQGTRWLRDQLDALDDPGRIEDGAP